MIVASQKVVFLLAFCDVLFILSVSGMEDTLWKKCNQTEDYEKLYCNDGYVPTPLPYHCPGLNISASCVQTSNILPKSKGAMTITNRKIIWTQGACQNWTSSLMSPSYTLRIETDSINKIYAIYLRSEYNISGVKVSRNISNTKSTAMRACSHVRKNIITGFDEFYCFTDKFPIESDEEIGFDANTIEIPISVLSIDPCTFLSEMKVYSYPDSFCKAPGLYQECQTLIPNTTFYLVGQTISYYLFNQNLKMVGNSARKCQRGGKWSGKPPVCADKIEQEFTPDFYCLNPCNLQKSWIPFETNQRIRPGAWFRLKNMVVLSSIQIDLNDNEEVEVWIRTTDKDIKWNLHSAVHSTGFFRNTKTKLYIAPDVHSASSTVTSEIFLRPILGNPTMSTFTIHGYTVQGNGCPSIDPIFKTKWEQWNDNQVEWFCEPGYEQDFRTHTSQTVTTCNRGIWTGSPPQCTRKECPLPPQMENADWKYESDIYYHRVVYECQHGFEQKNGQNKQTAECRTNTWRQPTLQCIATNCNAPIIENSAYTVEGNATITHEVKKVHPHGSVLLYNCDQGFALQGSERIFCNNTQWTGILPKCQAIRCHYPEIIAINASANASEIENRPLHGTIITFYCVAGLVKEGEINQTSITATCKSNGQWDQTRIVCVTKSSIFPFSHLKTIIIVTVVVGLVFMLILLVYFYRRCQRIRTENQQKTSSGAYDVGVTYENLKHRQHLEEEGIKDSTGEPIYTEATSSLGVSSANRDVLYCELNFNQIQNKRPSKKFSEEKGTMYATIVNNGQ